MSYERPKIDDSWQVAPLPMKLAAEDVHVWRVALKQSPRIVATLTSMLSRDELERANRYVFARDKEAFIIARGVLRTILAGYLETSPARLQFSYSKYSKPALKPDLQGLAFNVSHSGELALLAFTRNRLIGVDIEVKRVVCEAEQIAERYFSPQEAAIFRALPPADRQRAFFNCWTRKEAYIKAIGNGLSFPLDQFDVAFKPGEAAELINVNGDPQAPQRWSLQALYPASDYIAAIAVEGRQWQLSCWQWSSEKL